MVFIHEKVANSILPKSGLKHLFAVTPSILKPFTNVAKLHIHIFQIPIVHSSPYVTSTWLHGLKIRSDKIYAEKKKKKKKKKNGEKNKYPFFV